MSLSKIIKNQNFQIFLAGILLSFAFAPFHVFPIAVVSLSFFFHIISQATENKQAFKKGWIFAFGHFISLFYWISNALFVEIEKFFYLLPFALLLIPALAAIFVGLAILSANFFKQKFKLKKISYLFLLAIFWVIFELARSSNIILGGFPLGLLGYIWGFSLEISQFSAFITIYGLGFLAIIICSIPSLCFDYDKKIIVSVFVLSLLIIYLTGNNILQNTHKEKKQNIKVRLIQANIGQHSKQNDLSHKEIFWKNLQLSQNKGYKDIDIFIWGETAIAFLLNKDNKNILRDYFTFLPKNSILISGAMLANFSNDGDISKIWNSIIFINDKGEIIDFYDKHKLVPFGEYVPFRKFLPFIKKITFGMVDFSFGKKSQLISIKNLPNIIASICYETYYPFGIYPKKENSILINVTNDAWYGNSTGPYQNLLAAVFRAIENRITVIRVSNNGISAIIDSSGKILTKTDLNKEEVLDFEI